MNIGYYCYSPASINSFIPLIKEDKKNKIKVFFENEKAEIFFTEKQKIKEEKTNDFESFIKENEIIFYGTGSLDLKELEFVERAKKIKKEIITVTIQDIFWANEKNFKKRYKVKPDFVIVTTVEEKEKLKKVGISSDKVLVIGNPHFERLQNITIPNIERKGVVGFVSQCGNGGTYDEDTCEKSKTAIEELIMMKEKGTIKDFIVYKHPRENGLFYKNKNIELSATNELEDILKNEYIISNGSTPHYESMILGRKGFLIKHGDLEGRMKRKEYDTVEMELKNGKTKEILKWVETQKRP